MRALEMATVAPDPTADEAGEPAHESVEATPAPAKKKREETIEIVGWGKIPTADVAKHFDPACERRCDTGTRKAGRPFMGRVVWVRELCDCAIEGYKKAHPCQEEEDEPIVAGAIALAAARGAHAVPPSNPRGEQVKRLRARVEELAAELSVLRAEVAAQLGTVGEELTAAERAAAEKAIAISSFEGSLQGVRDHIAALQNRERAIVAELDAAQVEAAAGERAIVELRQRVEEISGSRGADERSLQRQIERVERRIARILERHPEAAGG